jgi:transposase
MKPLYVRAVTDAERIELEKGLRSSSAFTVRRSQIVLMSSQERLKAAEIAARLKCSDQCVREAIRAFEAEGVASLRAKSRARHDDQQALDPAGRAWLQGVIRRSPREFGYEGSLWTLDWLAEVAVREGYTPVQVTRGTLGRTLNRLGIQWRRAKQWINSPDAQYGVKKSGGIG